MAFAAGEREEKKEILVKRIVEVPTYKEVEIIKPIIKEKVIQINKPMLKEVQVAKPIFKEVVVEVPVYKEVEVIVEKVKIVEVIKKVEVPKFVEKIVEVPKYVNKYIPVEQVEITVKRREELVIVPVEKVKIVEREVHVDKPKFRERIVDVIKPHYVCQDCGKEV